MAMTEAENIDRLIRPDLEKLTAYQTIEPTDVLSQQAKIPSTEIIKLDGNENPYGCSTKVKEALAEYAYYHIYPDPEQRELKKALSAYIGIQPEYIVAGSGSDELIDLILRLFISPGNKVINLPPTFGMYPFCTSICGGETVNIPRNQDFSIDIPPVLDALDNKTKVIFIASPNNPSGNITPESDLWQLLEKNVIVVVDEAYAEFSKVTVSSKVPDYKNLIVLRTFSKWAGLAGLRIGYGIFPFRIASHLMKIKQPYNVNAAAQVAAIESLKDIDYLKTTIKKIVDEKKRLLSKLNEIKWINAYPSEANFILCKILNGKAKEIHSFLRAKGIFVRYFDTAALTDFLRISIGKPEDTDYLINNLKEIS